MTPIAHSTQKPDRRYGINVARYNQVAELKARGWTNGMVAYELKITRGRVGQIVRRMKDMELRR